MALVIAGDRSRTGKTTVTLAILAWLVRQSTKVQSFKVGPDYIDPMFHAAITRLPCRNLDPVLTSETYVKFCFARHSQNADWVVVEGVMGLFDGIRPVRACHDKTLRLQDYASTAHIARLLNLPVLLVLDCSRLSSSIAAIAFGYVNLDPQINIAGVVLNRVGSDRHLELLQEALSTINLPVLGVLRRNQVVTIPDRHLGLVPSEELPQLQTIFTQLAELAQTCFDWKKLLPLLKPPAAEHTLRLDKEITTRKSSIKIAVACDRAFNFYYQDNFDILRKLGAELVFWSPLADSAVPKVSGLYFGGGFPEVFAEQLANNRTVLKQLRQLILGGIPTYAECGGLMYLCDRLIDFEGKERSLVGVIPTTAVMQQKQLTLGYRQATAMQNTSVISRTQTVRGHEFHHSSLTESPNEALWEIVSFNTASSKVAEGWQIANLHASYLHLHFGEFEFLPQKFIQCCRNYQT
ncbi:cobyrinate a,c-diamide synthase [Myxosarcina sp. GI1]|uniref:cobyrinate a,c-diamide synthase n=1 Tax=Myxosarcina sp. GI1 TaxID=1541065 RepID=UPI00056C6A0E|nr:cobyrinate a,c-diamide synthase [Myxosarcina sp. GI1]